MIESPHLFAGKPLMAVPNRDKGSKWYISKKVWPLDVYPTWFQGLVYFLTPRTTAQLFQTALSTCYMHTDDVFIGIVVNKTRSAGIETIIDHSISKFANRRQDPYRTLRPTWDKGRSTFFHVPNRTMYYTWALEDMCEEKPPKPWFQW